MGKDYSIYTKADPGPAIVELTANLIKELPTVDKVHFVAFHEYTEAKPGVYIPHSKEVYIDLGNIMNSADLYRLGMMYIPAIYFTALWTLFHEITHARQVEADPELAELVTDPEDYEQAAQVATKAMMLQWVQENSLPDVKEWGWIGERILQSINSMYAQGETHLLDELDAMNAGAVASIETIMATYEFEYPDMLEASIEEGEFGIKINAVNFLTATDFFGLDQPTKSVAKSAQTISME